MGLSTVRSSPSSSSATRIAHWLVVVGYRVRVDISLVISGGFYSPLQSSPVWPNGCGDLLPTNTIPLSTCEYKVWYYRKKWNDSRKEYSASSSPQQSSSLRSSHGYNTWSLSTKHISIYTNANSLPFLLYLVIHRVCARQGDGATKGPQNAERSRHDSPERYQLVKDCRTNSSFFT